ncbi:GNAT family N-acetyltransferase [Jatrophihabitans sp. GAS493]|uniref:GNAT family N-acetyltransferase n=1 Tax=Jatrophihabitans sp. GAS493 TaxID=1907575 RepID=UPI0012FDC768|nr:GNAT family protein [Jatrophihabitans sp. GAS493]
MLIGGNKDAANYGQAVLTGELVRLRATRSEDLDLLARWQQDPSVLVTLQGWLRPPSEAAAKASTAERTANDGDGKVGFAIETRWSAAVEPTLIGQINAFDIRPQGRSASVGVFLGPEFSGHGYGTDALRTMVGYLFREVGLHRVQLAVADFNTAGRQAYRKAGFVEEGCRRKAIFHDGGWHDEIQLAILSPEWAPGASQGGTGPVGGASS